VTAATPGPSSAGRAAPGAPPMREGPSRADAAAGRWIARALLLALAFAAGAAWTLGGRLSAPAPRRIGPPPEALAGASEVAFESASGSRVRGWLAPGTGRGSVVLAHPVRADRRSMLGRARFLREAGYTVLLYDAQAHGESPGARVTFGHLEARDAAAAVAFARARDPEAPVAFLGVSLGAASALLGPSPLPVEALVVEAVHRTLREAVENRLAIRLGPPGRLLAPLLLLQVAPRLGVPVEALDPVRGIPAVGAPLLLVAGERDRHATLAQAQALFEAAPEPKELWVVAGAAHEDFHRVAREAYERTLLAFLARALAPPRSDAVARPARGSGAAG